MVHVSSLVCHKVPACVCSTAVFGSALTLLLMQVLGMISNQHYLYRMTVLVAITSLASVVTHETLYQHMLPVVVNCGKDKVCQPFLLGPMHNETWACHRVQTCALCLQGNVGD